MLYNRWFSRAALGTLVLAACTDEPNAPRSRELPAAAADRDHSGVDPVMVRAVRELAAARGVVPLARPAPVRQPLVLLGQALLFDPILSGNRNIACATCHLPKLATGDGLALSVGEGGTNFGPLRTHPEGVFIPRNAPPLFNLSAMKQLFWDGRVEVDATGQLKTPAGAQLTPAMVRVFEFGAASALGMFPATNRAEMRGQVSSGNELAAISLKCSICHNGATFSDDQFHNVAVAQIGPGEGDGPSGRDDFGRMRVTGDAADRYRFRTTPLRNVELTGPYGHSGAIASLRGFVEHYSESHTKLLTFDARTLEPALQGTLLPNAADILTTRDALLEGVVLPTELVDKLMDYMSALTDDAARNLMALVPSRVPSRLPVEPNRKQ